MQFAARDHVGVIIVHDVEPPHGEPGQEGVLHAKRVTVRERGVHDPSPN